MLDIELDLTGSGKVDENKDIGRQARDKRMKKKIRKTAFVLAFFLLISVTVIF